MDDQLRRRRGGGGVGGDVENRNDDDGDDDVIADEAVRKKEGITTTGPMTKGADASTQEQEQAEDDVDIVENEKFRQDPQLMSNLLFCGGSVLYLTVAFLDAKEAEGDDTKKEDASVGYFSSYWIAAVGAPTMMLINAIVDMQYARSLAFADRRRWETSIAGSLGLAPLSDLTAVLLISHPHVSSMAVHFYLLNGILMLIGRDIESVGSTAMKIFFRTCDLLYFAGSLIDVIISYQRQQSPFTTLTLTAGFDDSDNSASLLHDLNVWAIISGLLWTIDAILYIGTDMFLMIRDREEEKTRRKLE